MQDKKNSSIDTRSIWTIYSSLSPIEQDAVRTKLEKVSGRTRQTVWNWISGAFYPGGAIERNAVSQTLNRLLNIRTTPQTLFPEKP